MGDDLLEKLLLTAREVAHMLYLRIEAFNRTVPEDARITDKSLKTAQKRLLQEQEEGKASAEKIQGH